jgi:hypothetical protein
MGPGRNAREARVAPSDIDQAASEAEALVRIMGGNQRTTLAITAALRVSADFSREQQNSSQPATGVLCGSHRSAGSGACPSARDCLVPGMPAEVLIKTTCAARSSTCSKHFKRRLHGPFASDDRTRAGWRKFANREPFRHESGPRNSGKSTQTGIILAQPIRRMKLAVDKRSCNSHGHIGPRTCGER